MFGKSLIGMLVLTAAMFLTTQSSFAQGNLCLLGVGNCTPGGGANSNGSANRGGRKYLEGAEAAKLLQHVNYGSRYLLVLSRTNDGPGCVSEIRAWFSSIEAQSQDGRLMIHHGPTRTVRVCQGMMSADDVNTTEAYLHNWRSWLYELNKNPARYQNAQAWINYYTQQINHWQPKVAQVTP